MLQILKFLNFLTDATILDFIKFQMKSFKSEGPYVYVPYVSSDAAESETHKVSF